MTALQATIFKNTFYKRTNSVVYPGSLVPFFKNWKLNRSWDAGLGALGLGQGHQGKVSHLLSESLSNMLDCSLDW